MQSVPLLTGIGLIGLTIDLVFRESPQPAGYAAGMLLLLMVVGVSMWRRRVSLALGILMVDVALIAICAAAGLQPGYPAWWAFLLLPTVITGGYVSLRGAAAAAAASLVTATLVLVAKDASMALMVPILSFHLVVPPLWLFVAYQQDRLEDRRRAEIAANNERLSRAEELAGVGHLHVTDDTILLSPRAQIDLATGPELTRAEFDRLLDDGGAQFSEFLAQKSSGAVVLRYRHLDEICSALITRSSADHPIICTFQDITQSEADAADRLAMEQHPLQAAGLEAMSGLVGETAANFDRLLQKIRAELDAARDCSDDELEERVSALRIAAQEGADLTAKLMEASKARAPGGAA